MSSQPVAPRPRTAFFLALSAFVIAVVFAGFARTFFLRSFTDAMDKATGRELPTHLFLHGVGMTAWFSLFVAPTLFVRASRVDLHRKLGVAGVVMAVAVFATGVATVLRAVPRMLKAGEKLAQTRPAVHGNAAQLAIFSGLVAVRAARRREPAVHKRGMMQLRMRGPPRAYSAT